MSPEATLLVPGLAMEYRYVGELLGRLGLRFQVTATGPYKTALEPLTADAMTPAQREQAARLLACVDDSLRAGLAERVGAEATAGLFERVFIRADDARALRLIDDTCEGHDLPDRLSGRIAGFRRYLRRRRSPWRPLRAERYVAVVEVRGPIAQRSGPPGSSGPEVVVNRLRAAARDRRVFGIVLYVDSPGGSAIASDLIAREIRRARKEKPVVACLGSVAASGGYYVASVCDAIVAHPLTITGSIGVIAAKPVADVLLARIGVRTEVIKSAPHADLWSPARPLTEVEQGLLDREIGAFYAAFIATVAEGRNRPASQIEPLAGGRVWSGSDAHTHGLVDRLGGLPEALEEIGRRAQVPADRIARVPVRVVKGGKDASSLVRLGDPTGSELAPEWLGFAAAILQICRSAEPVLYLAPLLPREA
jgi:protease-4